MLTLRLPGADTPAELPGTLRARPMRNGRLPDNPPVRGLPGLLTARRLRASPIFARRLRAALGLTVALITLVGATAPPNSDDPYRTHLDPGVWPILIFIVALFVFGLVIRGSRPRRRPGPASAADRRPDQRRP